jgi:hypothetical protein
MIQDKIFFDEKDPTGLSYNTPFTYYGSYQGRLWSKAPTGSIKYYTQNSDLSAYATTGSNQFSGSQTVTGSLTVTGTITGTVAGTTATASYVEYTNVANKPALISGSAQIASFGIFATTGSNGFNGSQSITGSLTTTDSLIIANNDARIRNNDATGRIILGNSSTNTFAIFYGTSHPSQANQTVFANGGVTTCTFSSIGTAAFNSSVTAQSMKIENTAAPSFLYFNNTSAPATNYIALGSGANELYFHVNGSDRMLIKNNGNVGIGTSDPQYKLDINSLTSPATIGLKSDATYNSIIRDYTTTTDTFLDITTERTDGGGFNFLLLVSSTLTASGANRNYYTFAVAGRGTTATSTQLSNISAGTASRTAIAVSFPSNGVIR